MSKAKINIDDLIILNIKKEEKSFFLICAKYDDKKIFSISNKKFIYYNKMDSSEDCLIVSLDSNCIGIIKNFHFKYLVDFDVKSNVEQFLSVKNIVKCEEMINKKFLHKNKRDESLPCEIKEY